MKAVKKDITLGHIGKPNEEIKDAIVFELEEEDYSKAIKGLKTLEQKRIEKLEQENKELKEQLAIREKALELACQHLDELYLHNISLGLYKLLKIENSKYDYFIEQAKESIDGKIDN